MWWALHDVRLSELLGHLRRARPELFIAAILAVTATFPLRTVRWRYLLRLEGVTLPFRPLWHATAIGFMANNLLPARAGEFARAYAARALTGVRFSTAFASIVVERILDGMTLVALFAVAVIASDFPADSAIQGVSVERLALFGGVAFGGLFVAALAVVRWPSLILGLARRFLRALMPARWAERVSDVLEGMVEGLGALRTPGSIVVVGFWSLVLWLVNGASFWFALRAFGMGTDWSTALVVQGVIAFGVAVPSSPGYWGVFEAATRVSLGLYGIAASDAVSLAISYHVAGMLPITLLGLYSLGRAGLTLRTLQHAPGDDDAPRPPASAADNP